VKLYTRMGDSGETSLSGGGRVRKDDPRVAAYGTVDELNAHLGLAVSLIADQPAADFSPELARRLSQVQSELFNVGADLATLPHAPNRHRIPSVGDADVARLESWIDEAVGPVPALDRFILPGGTLVSAQLHVCRSVCRRAEREVVTLACKSEISPSIIVYINRLSDLLFAWARWVNHLSGHRDVPWINPKA